MTDDVQDRTLAVDPDETTGTDPAPAAAETPTTPTARTATPVVRRPSPANLRRQAKKEAARRAAEARRRARQRRRALSLGGVVAIVAVVLVAGYLLISGGDKKPTASPSNGAGCPPAVVTLDPVMCSQPTVTKGDGTLTDLKATPIVTGTGAKVTAGQWITVNYTGVSYTTGKQFDSSWGKGKPVTFQIGAGKVIQGWDQGLVGQTIGSRIQLDIPQALAYPDAQAGSDTAGPLRFVVDILDSSDTSPAS